MTAKTALFLMFLIGFFALTGLARADYSCVDNMTLKYNTTINVDGADIPIVQTSPCEYGCENGACNPPAWQQDIAIIGVIGFFLIIMALFLRGRM